MVTEYTSDRQYTLSQLTNLNFGVEQCLNNYSTSQSLINAVAGGAILSIGLWVTAPVSVAVGTIVAGFVFDTLTDVPNSKTMMEQGHYKLLGIENTMRRNNYTECRVRLAVLKKDNVELFKSAMAIAYRTSSGDWIEIG